jgi:hypothetical protein
MRRHQSEGVVRDVQHLNWMEQRLTRGQKYRVTRPFCDSGKDKHLVGEEWFFANSYYSIYYGILSVIVIDDEEQEWCITFADHDSTSDGIKNFVTRIPGEFREDLFATSRCIECLQPLNLSRVGYCPSCHLVWNPA